MHEVNVYLVWDNNAGSWAGGRIFNGVFGSFAEAESVIPTNLLDTKNDGYAQHYRKENEVGYGPYFTIERCTIRAEGN